MKYGEPWYVGGEDESGTVPLMIQTSDDGSVSELMNTGGLDANDAECEFLERMAVCVNACAGMDDPARDIDALRTELAALKATAPSPGVVEKVREAMKLARDTLDGAYGDRDRVIDAEAALSAALALLDAAKTGAPTMPVTEPDWADNLTIDIFCRPTDREGLMTDVTNALRAARASAEAENKRLREALEKIVVDPPVSEAPTIESMLNRAQRVALAALTPPKGAARG